MKVRVKFCGITHPDDAKAAVDVGADLVGLNFVPGTPRCLPLAVAEAIAEAVADYEVERVAIFRDADPRDIERVLRRVEVERVQLHGDEPEEEVEAIELPTIKALRGADEEAAARYPGSILLLDHPTSGGGRGQAWNWADAGVLIEAGYDVILAGGLDPESVQQAIEGVGEVLPWGVDVATGVESEPGRKDLAKMRAFVEAVRRAEGKG
ncbi:MAG: N-(5'-phosphoribosyl)anthranilate isomerase [Proteobacteria bacterium]|nr:MAG: N-(5'-phosphoribosyl)anthranilate isomerase [Pseudomonadota bacterium]